MLVCRFAPHLTQKVAESSFFVPHFGQYTISLAYVRTLFSFVNKSLCIQRISRKPHPSYVYVDFLVRIALAGIVIPIAKSIAPTMKVMLLMVGWK